MAAATTRTETEMRPHSRGEEEEDTIIDIPLLENSAKEGSKSRIYTEWSDCCIYRVPKNLRAVNEAAYTPQFVSIGPFHYGKPELKPMEKVKSRYLDVFCRRNATTAADLRHIFDDDFVHKIRASYAGNFHLKTTSEFIDVILTDGCFIIELLLRNWEKNTEDYILGKPWLRKNIELDLILLENQIPFFVLEKIYTHSTTWNHVNFSAEEKHSQMSDTSGVLCFRHKHEDREIKEWSKNRYKNCNSCLNDSHLTFLHLTRQYFSSHHFKFDGSIEKTEHLTDLLRSHFCPPGQSLLKFEDRNGRNLYLRTATMLDEAGIEFEVVENTYLSNITFKKGKLLRYFPCFNCSWLLKCLPCLFQSFPVFKFQQPTLKLPEIVVDDSTECVFRNLMALEQCHYPNKPYICNYVWLMDKLINTRDDVNLLIEKKVIINFLGCSKELADLFNSLSRKIVEENSCYYGCVQEINDHCKNPVNWIMATFSSVYFRDFWRGTATVVGVIVLVLTLWSFLTRIVKI